MKKGQKNTKLGMVLSVFFMYNNTTLCNSETLGGDFFARI